MTNLFEAIDDNRHYQSGQIVMSWTINHLKFGCDPEEIGVLVTVGSNALLSCFDGRAKRFRYSTLEDLFKQVEEYLCKI